MRIVFTTITNQGGRADVVGYHYRWIHRLEIKNDNPRLDSWINLVHITSGYLILLPRTLVGVWDCDAAPIS